jgi:hypothetical protein
MLRAAARRSGSAYVEVVVASVVFALTLTGMGATMVAQEKLMRSIERKSRATAVFVPTAEQISIRLNQSTSEYADPAIFVAVQQRGLPYVKGLRIEGVLAEHGQKLGPANHLVKVLEAPVGEWPSLGSPGTDAERLVLSDVAEAGWPPTPYDRPYQSIPLAHAAWAGDTVVLSVVQKGP